MDFDPALLRAFIAVQEAGGFTRAAERLHLSQSAVSHQIRRLEEKVGVALFVRTTRSLALTEDGEDFLRHAEKILRTQDALAQRFHRSSLTGAVRFGVPENFIGDSLPALLAQFARMFPAVRLDVTVDTYLALRAQVDTNALDVAVILSLEEQLDIDLLRRTQFVWAAAPGFDLAEHTPLPLAFSPKPCMHRQIGTDALDRAGLEWRLAFTSPSQRGLCAAVRAGLAITALPREDLEPGMLVVDGQGALPSLPEASFRLFWNDSGKTHAAKALAQLMAELSQIPPDKH